VRSASTSAAPSVRVLAVPVLAAAAVDDEKLASAVCPVVGRALLAMLLAVAAAAAVVVVDIERAVVIDALLESHSAFAALVASAAFVDVDRRRESVLASMHCVAVAVVEAVESDANVVVVRCCCNSFFRFKNELACVAIRSPLLAKSHHQICILPFSTTHIYIASYF
jgi:hypothetical protein